MNGSTAPTSGLTEIENRATPHPDAQKSALRALDRN